MAKRFRRHRAWTWKEARLPGDLLERLALRFYTEVYEAAAECARPEIEVLVALAELYAKQGLVEKGLDVDRRLVDVRPEEPVFHYNLACSHSLLGDVERAFAALVRAIQLGYDDFEQLTKDPDLANLRSDQRWRRVVLKAVGKKKKVEG